MSAPRISDVARRTGCLSALGLLSRGPVQMKSLRHDVASTLYQAGFIEPAIIEPAEGVWRLCADAVDVVSGHLMPQRAERCAGLKVCEECGADAGKECIGMDNRPALRCPGRKLSKGNR